MPGHVKLGKAGEPDPDPLPYLVVSMETRREDQNLEYDPKKSYWVPDGKGNYMKSLLVSDEGGKATVQCGHEKKVYKSAEIGQVNPPKFEKIEDMADLRLNLSTPIQVFSVLLLILTRDIQSTRQHV
jgi:myosin heavy chain 6/7